MKLAVLGAGKPPHGKRPTASEQLLAGITPVKRTMSVVGADPAATQIVAGYEHEEIQRKFPDVLLRHNLDWETSGSVESFFQLDLNGVEPLFITYSDIVFSRRLVDNLVAVDADAVIGWDSRFLSKHVT